MLDYTMYYFIVTIFQLSLLYGFKKLSNHKDVIYKKFFVLPFLFSIIFTLEFYYNLSSLNALTSFICYYITFYAVFRRNLKDTIFYGTVVWIIAAGLDVISMYKSEFLNYETWNINQIIIRAIDSVILSIVLVFLYKIKKLNNFIEKLYLKLGSNFPYVKLILLLIIIFSLCLTLLFTVQNVSLEKINKYIYILSGSVIMLIYLYLNKEYENAALKETKLNLIQNNEFYINTVNDYKILKHNIIHQLNGIKSVANKEAQELITDLIEQYNSNFINVQELTTMPTGINGIIYEKMYSYQNKNLKLGIENKITSNIFDNLTARSYNLLCESLGILLDNALEATSDSKEKIIMIDMKETSKSYNVKIINTFSDVLDFDRLGTIKYTTKKSGNGIGLFSILGRKKLKVKTSIINNLFQNEIIINKIPKKKIIWS